MKPQFPIVQIDFLKVNLDLMAELFRFDTFYHSKNISFFETYIQNKHFVDSKGRVFAAKDMIPIKSFLAKLGIGKMYTILYEYCNEEKTFEEVKKILVSNICQLKNEEGKDEWVKSLKNANTIKELIEAER